MEGLKHIVLDSFVTQSGKEHNVVLSYQLFGKPLFSAPVVLVNHALTGNSNVCGNNGWWKELIGPGEGIDTDLFTILAFNIPGNGYDRNPDHFINEYKDFTTKDIAVLFYQGIDQIGINELYAAIGGSLGGGIAWEMMALRPNFIQHLIPIGSDWKSTDWVVANCKIQDELLNSGENGMGLARKHAMTLYRNPIAFGKKFKRSMKDSQAYKVEDWLDFHADTLGNRFHIASYKMMNQLLRTINVASSDEAFIHKMDAVKTKIHMVAITTDLLFSPEENQETFNLLQEAGKEVELLELDSYHGHDAFLIEHEKLKKLIAPIFKKVEAIS